MTLKPMPDQMRRFLDWTETTEQWVNADKHWMEMMLGESLEEYDLDGPHFAHPILDYTMKLREIVREHHPSGTHEGDPDCELVRELAVLATHMSFMCAIATRELRGKPPVWSLDKNPIDPDSR
jgi:hypothetical protein